jgi:hypothetical protein
MPAALLKQAVVLFDNVFWHRGMVQNIQGISLPAAEQLAAEWASSYNSDEQASLTKNRRFCEIFRDVEELAPDLATYIPDPFVDVRHKDTTLWRVGMPIARKMAAKAFNRTEEEVEAGAVGNTWQSTPSFVEHDFQIVDHLRGRFPDLAGVFTAAHVAIGAALYDARREPGNPLKVMLDARTSETEGVIPDFSAFSWEEILELRTDARAIAFRRKVADLAKDPAAPSLSAEVIEGLRNLAVDVRPKPISAAVWGALGMIPAVFNPFGAFSAGDAFRREVQRGVNYNWLYFLIDAQQRQRA